MVVIKNNFYITFLIVVFLSNSLLSSQIYDYQTEKFIEKLNLEILEVNQYNKKINFKIIKDDFPNAFVTKNNNLFISSGLLIYSPDYVSLLAVLAHEIGHIEKYHVAKRINEIDDLKKINSIGNIAAIAGSMIMQQPEIINTIAVNQTAINNLYLNFSQDQEKEADLYAVETLNKLNLPTESIKEFLLILENKTNTLLLDTELKKFSTHPLFEERYAIIDFNKIDKFSKIDNNKEKEYKLIKAKFIAYTNSNLSKELKDEEKIYYEAIRDSLSGNLLSSLKKLNILILNNKNNLHFIETKADILLSYGYNKEAIEFYKKVLNKYPKNNYAKFNIFINSNYNQNEENVLKDIFLDNVKLIKIFPNNIDLIKKLYNLSIILNNDEWNLFFEILLFNKKNLKRDLNELERTTKIYDLKKLIKLYK